MGQSRPGGFLTGHPLIIRKSSTRPLWARTVDTVLSLVMWLLYFYMIRRVLVDSFLFSEETYHWLFDGTGPPFVPEIWRFFVTVRTYVLIVLVNSGVFVAWALYNQFCFGGLSHQQAGRSVTADDLGQLYSIPTETVTEWQSSRVLTMYHGADGTLMAVTSGPSHRQWHRAMVVDARSP